MARLAILALAVLVALAAVVRADDVVILTADNFDTVISENSNVLVEFFAPWCGHCKTLAPHYAKAATTLKSEGIILASVDATVERDLGTKYGVRGYPTLKFFKNGVEQEYKGGRTEETIVSYLRKKVGPAAKTISTADELSAFTGASKVAVVGFFAQASGAEYDAFVKVADKDEEKSYAVTTNADLASAEGVSAPAVVLFKKFDEGKNTFSGAFTESEIAEFVSVKGTPLVIPFSMDVVGSIFQSKLGQVAFLFTESKDTADFQELAKQYQGKIVFATADASEPRLTAHVGLTKEDFPKLIILTTSGQMKKFPLDAAPTKEAVAAHIDSFLAGTLKPTYKSDPIPASNDGPVTVIVGKNFDEIVLNPAADVLLEVYAPWCGHCKKLEPVWQELGEAFKSNPNVVIAKMDGTGNEVDGLSVSGFPTIKFYPKGASKARAGTEYNGGREVEDFKKFLAEKTGAAAESHDEL